MKTSKNAPRLIAALCLVLVLSSETFAQNSRGHRYGNYYGSRTHVTVGIGINPYYHYHPVCRPRIYYHPPYRLPYPYGHYGPAFGLTIGVLPFGYNQFYIGGNPFYYYNGIYYRPKTGGGYTVTQPPMGAMVKHLPSGARLTVIDGQKYYVLGGTFYQERLTANNKVRYEVVGTDGVLNTTNADGDDDEKDSPQVHPPVQDNKDIPAPVEGTTANQLPAGSTAVIISQQKYYISPAGVYYQEVIDGNNKVSYKVAGNAAPGSKTDADSPGAPVISSD